MTHDPVCPCSGICDPPGEPCSMSGCGCECEGIALGRADERRLCGEEAQAAVAKMDIRNPNPSYSRDLALAWNDGWHTGYLVALSRVARDAEETE